MLSLLLVTVAFAQEPCFSGADLHQIHQAMRQGLFDGAFVAVAEQGKHLQEVTACLNGPASAEDLALAWQYAGIAALMRKDRDEPAARRAFRQAAVIGDEAVPFDAALASNFSLDAATLYAEELKAAKEKGYGMLSFCQQASLYGLGQAPGAQQPALAGEHLIQLATPSGAAWAGHWIDVQAGAETGVMCKAKKSYAFGDHSVAMLSAGGAGVVGGTIMLGTTFAWWRNNMDHIEVNEEGGGLLPSIVVDGEDRLQQFERMRAINIAGGALALAGGGLVALGGGQLLLLPPTSDTGWVVGSTWRW